MRWGEDVDGLIGVKWQSEVQRSLGDAAAQRERKDFEMNDVTRRSFVGAAAAMGASACVAGNVACADEALAVATAK